jgi:plastocyanin
MRKPLLIMLALVALLGAACGGSSDNPTPTGANPTTASPTGNPTGSPTGGTDCTDVTGDDTVEIEMTDNAFTPDCLIYAPVPVHFTNNGTVEHNFSIAGTAATVDEEPGADSTVSPSVWSTPGEYIFFCKYHGAEDGTGMAGTITIVPA